MTRKLTLFLVCAFEIGLILFVAAWTVTASEQRVRQIINESIASYPGKCACPYSLMSNGRKCGKRVAEASPDVFEHCLDCWLWRLTGFTHNNSFLNQVFLLNTLFQPK